MINLISSIFKYSIIILTCIVLTNCNTQKRICGDPLCSVHISSGKTTNTYSAPSKDKLSFKINTYLRVFSKPVVTGKDDLWEIELQGRRGLAPARFIKEEHVLISKSKLMEVEIGKGNENLSNETDTLKSSEANSAGGVDTTTTAPLAVEQIHKNINIETKDLKDSERPVSTPVQEKVEVIDGTSIYSVEESDEPPDSNLVDSEEDDYDISDDLDDDDDDAEDDEDQDSTNRANMLKEATPTSTELNHSEPSINELTPDQLKENVLNIQDKNNHDPEKLNQKDEISFEEVTENLLNLQDDLTKKTEEENLKKTETMENNSTDKIENNVPKEDITPEVIEKIEPPKKFYQLGSEENNITQNEINSHNQPPLDQNSTEINEENLNSAQINIEENKPLEVVNDDLEKQNVKVQVVDDDLEKPKQNNKDDNLEKNPSEPDVLTVSSNDTKMEDGKVIEEGKDKEDPEIKNDKPSVEEVITIDLEKVENKNDEIVEKYVLDVQNIEKEDDPLKLKNNEIKNEDDKLIDEEKDKQDPEIKNDKSTIEEAIDLEKVQGEKVEKISEESEKLEIKKQPELETENEKEKERDTTGQDYMSKDNKYLNTVKEKADGSNDMTTQKPVENSEENDQKNEPEVISAPTPAEKKEDTPMQDLGTTTPTYEDQNIMEPNVETSTENPSTEETIHTTDRSEEIISNNNNIYNQNSEEKKNSESLTPHTDESNSEQVEDNSIISTILDTFNSFWSSVVTTNQNTESVDLELERLLYPNGKNEHNRPSDNTANDVENKYCEKIGPDGSCPKSKSVFEHDTTTHTTSHSQHSGNNPWFSEVDFFSSMSDKILEMFDLLVCMSIAAASSLLFAFGYYCICNSRKENSLISKLNIVERNLLASNKEVLILKHDLVETRNKLTSIEDSSFGSNDMVISLKQQLEGRQEEKEKMQEQIGTLEKELENAAEAGLELNKIVSELLSQQNGDNSIANSVEELQKQLNEQQNTIFEINTMLAEKSRENSELHVFLSEQSQKFGTELEIALSKVNELEQENLELKSLHDENEKVIKENIQRELEMKSKDLESLQYELKTLRPNYEDIYKKWQSSESKVESLEECIKNIKKDSSVDLRDVMDVVDIKANNLELKKEKNSLKDRLEGEIDARKLLEGHVKIISEEVSSLKKEYNQSEKDKLEAQTRLDVLSNYFKDKETQLQKELSVKEAMWLKQQGETTSTVERVRAMQDEIQALKSQNDSMRAEIDAQSAAHKAQIGSLENRAHESWLLSRQTERKFDEARSEAAALRRKLTQIAGANNNISGNSSLGNDINRLQNSAVDGIPPIGLNNAPSPIHMDSPSSPPLLGGMPPPLPFLPPSFLPPLPTPFMGMPAPFALPPGELRPPPLGGRLMSPPPPPHHGRYSPSIIDDDYDDDEYDDRPRRGGGNGRYSPENGRYTPDSRYNYTTDLMSTYDTESDSSPTASPRGGRGGSASRDGRYNERSPPFDRGNNGSRGYKAFSPPPKQSSTTDNRNKKSNKGMLSSGSEKSYDSRRSKGKVQV